MRFIAAIAAGFAIAAPASAADMRAPATTFAPIPITTKPVIYRPIVTAPVLYFQPAPAEIAHPQIVAPPVHAPCGGGSGVVPRGLFTMGGGCR